MDQPRPLITMEGMLAELQSQGLDPRLLDVGIDLIHGFLYSCLPDPPVYTAAYLSAAAYGYSGVDRVSTLPDDLLRSVVSRLPAKDAARTAALSSRWSRLWRSVPLVLADTHLLPPGVEDRPARAASGAVTAAVSRVLEAHPGPFRCVNLTCCYMDAHRAELARWLHLLAVKGVQELVFVNRPWPMDFPLPATVFTIASLSRLYLGVWRFPNTAALPRGACFPNLRELGLSFVVTEDRDLEFVLARSPVLEALMVSSSQKGVRLRLVSGSLRSVQLCMCVVEDIAVVDAPRLERFFLWETFRLDNNRGNNVHTRFKFAHAPKLRLLGYLRPGIHVLEIGNTIIKAGTKPNPRTIIPSVNILALKVHFQVRNEAKMLPSFLRCFPNVETLHVESEEADEPAGKLNLKFWQEADRIECVQSCIKKLVFHEYRGERSELAFLKFILMSAQVLQEMVIRYVNGSFSSRNEVDVKLKKPLSSVKRASVDCSLMILESTLPQGGSAWCFHAAPDFSVSDPFSYY